MVLQEKILIRELKRGNAKAFEELYYRYHARLYNFCLGINHSAHEAEGVVQEVFIAIWENRTKLDEEKSFSGFVFRIARNKVLNGIKHNISKQVYLDYLHKVEQPVNALSADFEYKELFDFIQRTISELPEKTKNIFLLSRNEGFTYKEIAQKLNVSENVVDHEIRKSLQHIKSRLKKFYTA